MQQLKNDIQIHNFHFYLFFVSSSPGRIVPVRKILVVRSGNEEIQSAFIISLFYYKTGMIGRIGSTKLVLPKWHKYGTLNRGRKSKNDYLLKIVFWTTLYEMVAAVHR